MTPRFTLRNLTGFGALLFVLHELHEIVHTAVGRWICGCWGPRDFNVWRLCESCPADLSLAVWATFAGPIFTYGVMYVGYYLMGERFERRPGRRSLGFALVFGAMPMARIFTAAVGGGDEVYAFQRLWADQMGSNSIWIGGLILVLVICLPPLIRAWRVLDSKGRVWVFAGFLVLPFVFDVAVVLFGMNTLLEQGVLDQSGFIGSPVLVNLWTLLWVGVLAGFWSTLKELLRSAATY